jgi:hypothetical protein
VHETPADGMLELPAKWRAVNAHTIVIDVDASSLPTIQCSTIQAIGLVRH